MTVAAESPRCMNIVRLDALGYYLERWPRLTYAHRRSGPTRSFGDVIHPTANSTNPLMHDVYALWDQLAEFSVGNSDAALTHLLSSLRTMLSARNVLWGVLVRLPSPKQADPLLGWRPRLVRVLDPIPAVAASVQKQYDTLWSNKVDLSQILSMSGDEPFRVRLLFEALPPEWFEGEHYRRHYLDVGFADSISVRIALNDDVRVRLFVFRDAQAPRFSAQDGQHLGYAMRALRWFH